MKKTLIALMIITIIMTVWHESSVTASSRPTPTPTPIQDPLLLQAWEQLNSLTEPVQLPDGSTITGHDLAQFIMKKNVPIK